MIAAVKRGDMNVIRTETDGGPFPDAETFISQLYESVLRREIRSEEMQPWVSGLQAGSVDLPRLVYAVLHSPEARAQRGVYGSANSEQDFTTAIKLTYESMLGRTASDEDVGLWWSALLQNLQSVSGIIVQISTSDEALQWRRRRDASSPAEGRRDGTRLEYAAPDRTVQEVLVPTLAVVHQQVSGAAATPADIARWTDRLNSDPSGVTGTMASLVAELTHLARRPPTDSPREEAEQEALEAIRLCYRFCYGRTVTESESALWHGAIKAGDLSVAGMVCAIARSPEAMSRVAPAPAALEQPHVIGEAVRHLYNLAFHRTAGPDEVAHWVGVIDNGTLSVAGMVCSLANSGEAVEKRALLPEVPDGLFLQVAYEMLLGRGAMIGEVAEWQRLAADGHADRNALVRSFFLSSARAAAAAEPPTANDATHTHVLGTNRQVGLEEWRQAGLAAQAGRSRPASRIPPASYPIRKAPRVLVSAIASLYRGEAFIDKFLRNITSQTIFESHSELIIVDANSPENERAIIEPYLQRYRNIRYVRCPNRIGIYEAWNLGASLAAGDYLTNTNMDDLRRADSFELQAGVLESLTFVDVVYQDLYYSFDPSLDFEDVAARDFVSDVPVITPQNLLAFNSPHNAPMWRRSLHDDVGGFDTSYRSAGDYEFWLRCAKKNKTFFKINDPHVVYYVNPAGISTRPDTRGIVEANRIGRMHARSLIPPHATSSPDDFLAELERVGGQVDPGNLAPARDRNWRYTAVQSALRSLGKADRGWSQDTSCPRQGAA